MGLYADSSSKRWLILSVIFGLFSLAILLYVTSVISVPESAFGQRWTSVEIVLLHLPNGAVPGVPVSVDLPLQFKPITGFMVFSFLWFVAACQSLKPQFLNMSSSRREVIVMLAFLLCLVTGYEFVWNFMAFGAILTSMPTSVAFNQVVDRVAFQYTYYAVNAVFATKMFACAFAIGVYAIYFLRGLEKRGVGAHP